MSQAEETGRAKISNVLEVLATARRAVRVESVSEGEGRDDAGKLTGVWLTWGLAGLWLLLW